MPTFTPKAWSDVPSTSTPVNAAGLIDLETRLSNYVVAEIEALVTTINVTEYGAVCNGQRVGQITSNTGSPTVSSPVAAFTAADVGKLAVCFSDFGAGTVTTIQTVVSATQVTLAANAGVTLTGASTGCFMIYGTDDSTAVNAALTAAATLVNTNTAIGYNTPIGTGRPTVAIPASAPDSLCCVSHQIVVPPGVQLDCQSMIVNLQTDRFNPVVLFDPYAAFNRLLIDGAFGAGVQMGTTVGGLSDCVGGTYVAWHIGLSYDSGTSRYQDALSLIGNSHLIDMVWTKGGYHCVNHNTAGDVTINRAFAIGCVQPILMENVNQVSYGKIIMDTCGQVGGGTSGIVLDNGCSDVTFEVQAFPVSTVSPARSLDNVVLLGNGSTNKNIDIRGKVSAQLTGGVGLNLAQAQDVSFELLLSNTTSSSSGGANITKSVTFGTTGGAVDIRATLSSGITPYSGTVAGRYEYTQGGVAYVVQSGSNPSSAAGANNGTGPPGPYVTGNDARGYLGFGSGTGPSAGAQINVTFSNSAGYVGTPIVVVTPRNSASAALNAYVGVSTTGFTISTVNAPAASQANSVYAFNYKVFG